MVDWCTKTLQDNDLRGPVKGILPLASNYDSRPVCAGLEQGLVRLRLLHTCLLQDVLQNADKRLGSYRPSAWVTLYQKYFLLLESLVIGLSHLFFVSEAKQLPHRLVAGIARNLEFQGITTFAPGYTLRWTKLKKIPVWTVVY